MVLIMKELLYRYPKLLVCEDSIKNGLNLMKDTYLHGGKILICGNGGSCADCEHIVGELMKGFLSPRKINNEDKEKIKKIYPDDYECFYDNLQRGISAISLPSQVALASAYINDVCADMVYAQLVFSYGREYDMVIGLSTSGNSKNVVNAMKIAKVIGLKTLALTGEKACMLDEICDVVIKAPETETYKIQEYHLPIYHYLCAELERLLCSEVI